MTRKSLPRPLRGSGDDPRLVAAKAAGFPLSLLRLLDVSDGLGANEMHCVGWGWDISSYTPTNVVEWKWGDF